MSFLSNVYSGLKDFLACGSRQDRRNKALEKYYESVIRYADSVLAMEHSEQQKQINNPPHGSSQLDSELATVENGMKREYCSIPAPYRSQRELDLAASVEKARFAVVRMVDEAEYKVYSFGYFRGQSNRAILKQLRNDGLLEPSTVGNMKVQKFFQKQEDTYPTKIVVTTRHKNPKVLLTITRD